MRIIISGGGTAGHINPGLYIAQKILSQEPDSKILWVGVKGRREEDIVPRHDIDIQFITMQGIKRSLMPPDLIYNLKTIGLIGLGLPLRQSLRIIKKFKPGIVLGTGGFVCAPVIAAALIKRIPAVLFENNSIPGLAVRMLSRYADRVCIAYENAAQNLSEKAKIKITGNPVDPDLSKNVSKEVLSKVGLDPNKKTLLVMGGSLGSRKINQALIGFLNSEKWKKEHSKNWQVWHSTGKARFNEVEDAVADIPSYAGMPYIYENLAALNAADVMVSRAGATSIAEITALGIPAVLIPWPGAAGDHQTYNAGMLEKAYAAVTVKDDELNAGRLGDILTELMTDDEKRRMLSANCRKLGRKDGAAAIVELLQELHKNK